MRWESQSPSGVMENHYNSTDMRRDLMTLDIEKKANKMLTRHTEIMVNTIKKWINPIAIYLTGSFGRGEGTVFLNEGKILPLRDYDVLIITLKPISHQTLYRIKKEIEKKIGIPLVHFSKSDRHPFEVWLTQLTVQDLKVTPILKVMDVKYSAKLLWGKDLRDIIEVEPHDLSTYNVFMILGGFLSGIIYELDPRVLQNTKFYWRRVDLVYQCLKIYIEMSTALLLLKGMYAPSFSERVSLFSEVYDSRFRLLSAIRPELPNRMRVALETRRTLTKEVFDRDKIDLPELLHHTMKDTELIFEYFITETTGKKIGTEPLSDWLFENARWIMPLLLSDLFQRYLTRKRIFSVRTITQFISNVYLMRSSLIAYRVARKIGLPVKIGVIFRPGLLLELYAIAFDLIKYVVSPNRNDENIAKAMDKCSKIVDLRKLGISRSTNLGSLHGLIIVTRLLLKITDGVVHNKGIPQQLDYPLRIDSAENAQNF